MYTTKKYYKNTDDLFPQLDRVLNEVFNTSINHLTDDKNLTYAHPKANVIEYKDRFVIDLMVPGLNKEDVKIKVEKQILSISSDKNSENGNKYRLAEFKYGVFERKFRLPHTIDLSDIGANLLNGVLRITLNKKKEEIDNGPKDIEIS